ncbi:hypothetical protein FB567DRAFT_597367 [Paraphoma chrysanthemicola]|uniref:Uncharacterized protein n=1 Tax=Paraphoma chrysanthemicola TaxID=798071 RepID=A0A8K0QWS7_9PLEO|nr:hypothetical protein FB567DRAFT_597367 [Paraphoma chrysanthemicola]
MSFANSSTADARPACLNMRPTWSLARIINTNSHLPRPIIVRLLDNRLTSPSKIAQTTTARRDEARQKAAHKRRGIQFQPEHLSSLKNIERPLRLSALSQRIAHQLSEQQLRCAQRGSEIDSKAVHLTHLNSQGPAMNDILLTLLKLLRDGRSPDFEQTFDFFKSHLQLAEPLLRHLGSWAKDSNWDWKSFKSLHDMMYEQAERGDSPQSGTRQPLIKLLEHYAGIIGIRLNPSLRVIGSSVQFDFASGAPPLWGVGIDTDVEITEPPAPSSHFPDQSNLPSGGSGNDFSFSAPESNSNNFTAIRGSGQDATPGFDTGMTILSSPSDTYDSALISNFDTFLGLYTHPSVSTACQREIDRLKEQRGSLHPVDLSQDFLEPFIISVRTFLAHADWSYHHAECFARNASSWIQLTVDLREALKNERWVWDSLGRDLWVLRQDLIKVGVVASEQLEMLPEQHQSVTKRPCNREWEAWQTLHLDVRPGFASMTVPGADMAAHTIESTVNDTPNTLMENDEPTTEIHAVPESLLASSNDFAATTQNDILQGLNTFDPNNVHRNSDLLAIFSHPTFRALISTSLANLRHTMVEKGTTATIDTVFLRRVCGYFIHAYKQSWFRWQKFEKNEAVLDSKQQLNILRDELATVDIGHNMDEARALKRDVDDLIDVLEGKELRSKFPVQLRPKMEDFRSTVEVTQAAAWY